MPSANGMAEQDLKDRGVVEIVEAVIDDTRELVEAHIDGLREDMSERVSNLGATLTSSLLAFSLIIVTALLLGVSIAVTLVAVGLPIWAAFWIVTFVAAGCGVSLIKRTHRKAKETVSPALPATTTQELA